MINNQKSADSSSSITNSTIFPPSSLLNVCHFGGESLTGFVGDCRHVPTNCTAVSSHSLENWGTCCCPLGGYNSWTPLFFSLDMVICVAAFLGNLIVIISVWKYRFLRTAATKFVVSLAVSDLLVSLCIPYYVTFYFNVSYICHKFPCVLRYFMFMYTTILSLTSLIGAAADRYVAIVKPLSYRRIMGSKWINIIIAGIYAYAALLTLPMLINTTWNSCIPECDLVYIASAQYVLGVIDSHVLATLIISLTLYVQIFIVAFRQRRALVATSPCSSHNRPMGTSSIPVPLTRLHKDTHLFRTMVLVMGACIIGLVPYFIVVALHYCETFDPSKMGVMKRFVVCLYFGKSSVNPIIYAWKNADFRIAFGKLLCNRNLSQQATVMPTDTTAATAASHISTIQIDDDGTASEHESQI